MSDKFAKNYLQAYLSKHQLKSFKKKELIIFQGEAPRCAYVIKSGIVKAYNISVGGDEKPVAFYEAGSVFPLSWVYGKVPSALYYYEAFTDEVEVYLVDRLEFISFIKKRPELLYQELERLLIEQIGGSIRLNALQHSRAGDKLIYTLHYLGLSHGKRINKNEIELGLSLTHQDFANLTGLTRETAATELNKLKKLGVIHYDKNTPYRLDLNRLMLMLNDQFIADIQPISLT